MMTVSSQQWVIFNISQSSIYSSTIYSPWWFGWWGCSTGDRNRERWLWLLWHDIILVMLYLIQWPFMFNSNVAWTLSCQVTKLLIGWLILDSSVWLVLAILPNPVAGWMDKASTVWIGLDLKTKLSSCGGYQRPVLHLLLIGWTRLILFGQEWQGK